TASVVVESTPPLRRTTARFIMVSVLSTPMSWRFFSCAALFITCLLTANTIAAKLIVVGGVVLTAGVVIFPLSYVVADVAAEVGGQALDSGVFVTLAFAGTVPAGVLAQIVGGQWVFKVLYEAAATPLTYAAVAWLKAREGVDAYDYDTDFNPVRL